MGFCRRKAGPLATACLLAALATNDAASAQTSLSSLLPGEVRAAGVIKVGGPSAISPYVFVDDAGKMQGLIFDLMTAVGEKLGVKVAFSNINYSALIPALQARRVDVGIGTFTDTLEREEQVDFVDYITTKLVLMGRPAAAKDIRRVADLCGRTAATPSGTTSEIIMKAQADTCQKEGRPKMTVLVVPSPAEAQLQVETGRADAFIQAYGVGIGIAKSGQNIVILGEPFRPEYHGAGVRKGNAAMAQALLAGFKAIMDDGTYSKVLAGYGVEALALAEPLLNGTATRPLPQ